MSTIKVDTLNTRTGSGNITFSRPITGLSGSGASLTALNATEITSGTIPDARLPATLPARNGSALTALNATQLTSGTIPIARIADDAITLAKMAGGTDGQVITYDASGNPVAVGPGTDGQVLTSTGAGSPPAFEDAAGGGVDGIVSSANATAITIDSNENILIGTTNAYVRGMVDIEMPNSTSTSDHLHRVGLRLDSRCDNVNEIGPSIEMSTSGNAEFVMGLQNASTSGTQNADVFFRIKKNTTNTNMKEVMRFKPTGIIEIQDAIKFPASQSASSDANALDDYEEGSFTPTIQDSSLSNSESQVYHGNQIGVYTKVGRVVTCNGYMNINSSSLTGSDPCYLAGFPFTSRNNGTERAIVSFGDIGGLASNISTDYQMVGVLEGNRTYAHIQAANAQSGSNQFTVSTLSGGYFAFSVTYFV